MELGRGQMFSGLSVCRSVGPVGPSVGRSVGLPACLSFSLVHVCDREEERQGEKEGEGERGEQRVAEQ